MPAGGSVVCALLFLALGQSPDANAPAIVSGRVVDAGTGRPIAGVVVTPAGSALPPPQAADGTEPPHVLTNANGLFVIRGLHEGSLVLTATKGGYVNATRGQRRPAGSAQPLPIKDGDRVNDVDIRMWKQARDHRRRHGRSGRPGDRHKGPRLSARLRGRPPALQQRRPRHDGRSRRVPHCRSHARRLHRRRRIDADLGARPRSWTPSSLGRRSPTSGVVNSPASSTTSDRRSHRQDPSTR